MPNEPGPHNPGCQTRAIRMGIGVVAIFGFIVWGMVTTGVAHASATPHKHGAPMIRTVTVLPNIPTRRNCTFSGVTWTSFAESVQVGFDNSDCSGERARLICQYDERGVITSVDRDGNTVSGDSFSEAQCTVITGATRDGYNWFGYQIKQTNGTWKSVKIGS